MVCYHPIKVFWSRKRHPVTKNRVPVFSPTQGIADVGFHFEPGNGFFIPCGKCEGCRLSRSFEWSVRCVCESYSHDESYFLTLTYDAEHLPSGGNLCRADFQSFMKRLRWHFRGYKLKVLYCGEYGEYRHRPHYHAIIFGLPLSREDVRLYPEGCSRKGNINYVSPYITEIWGKGRVTIGTFSSQSASYVAQYTLKKSKSYTDFLKSKKVVPPFLGMSNRSAIGFDFFVKFFKDIFSRGIFNPLPVKKGDQPKLLRPLPFFVRSLKKYYPVEYIRYVRIPRIRSYCDILRKKALCPSEYSADVAKKIKVLYYKERATLRRLEARCDL